MLVQATPKNLDLSTLSGIITLKYIKNLCHIIIPSLRTTSIDIRSEGILIEGHL